jgi:hypothetical protein
LTPFQERVRSISDEELDGIFARGAERAGEIARATYKEVKERLGIEGARRS